jgi:hypothetical protein
VPGIDDVLERHGIDQGDGCRKLLSAATNIIQEVSKGYNLGFSPEQ